MSIVSCVHRLVVEYKESGPQGQMNRWVPPLASISMHDGQECLTIGYSGDRGFARLCGGDCKTSNPLRQFAWITEAIKRRDEAVKQAYDKVAMVKCVGHISGTHITGRIRRSLEIPELTLVDFEEFEHDGRTVPATTLRVVPDAPGQSFRFAWTPDSLSYVMSAMRASKSGVTQRPRPAHDERLSAKTGVKGVWKHSENKVRSSYTDDDGVTRCKVAKLHNEECASGNAKAVCKLLQGATPKKQQQQQPVISAAARDLEGDADEQHECSVEDEAYDDAPLTALIPDAASSSAAPPEEALSVAIPEAPSVAPKHAMLHPAWKNIFKQ